MAGTGEGHLAKGFLVLLSMLALSLLGILSWGLIRGNLAATTVAGVGIATVITMASSTLLASDDQRSQSTERILRVASATQYHMRGGLTAEGCRSVCQLLLSETGAVAIAMTDTRVTLAYVGEGSYGTEEGSPTSGLTRGVLRSGRVQTFSRLREDHGRQDDHASANSSRGTPNPHPVGIIVPLTVSERTVGTIELYYRVGGEINRTQLAIARGLAELLSSQLSVNELDRQAEMTARAEVKALQAQINPHFLFNTLNTIAAFTRIDPTRARDLLREFSVFYRRTLEGTEAPIPLSAELEQTRRYLTIERARFGDDRIILTEDVEGGCGEVKVPAFIVQPIVENAVRHAMREEGPLHIDVQVATDGDDLLVAVADDGVGMDEEVAERLLGAGSPGGPSSASQGTGIALRNVADRIELFYGEGSGVEIMSKADAGTCVTLRLVGVAPVVLPRTSDEWDEQG
ncbi:MAG: histidine kinase [Acidobacteriota bacterium]|nr:histidine kinase [Acidobacteriota bacterium]